MSLLFVASLWLAAAADPSPSLPVKPGPFESSPLQSALQLTVDAKNGDTISGEKDFRVTVASQDAINQVEFYVGDELRDTETSTPYVFPLDTVELPDGAVTVRFKAYSVQSKTVEKTLMLTVDNGKSKGADFHVQAAQDDLTDSKYKEAATEGRIALSIDGKSVGAKIVLARANLGLKALDRAQKYAEDATTQDPKNVEALQLLAAVDVRRAFNTFAAQGADRSEVVSNIGEALKAAVTAQKESLDVQTDAIGDATDANALKLSDAANLAERYSLTLSALQHRMEADPKNPKVVDRLAYAQMRSGRYQDALNTLALAQSHAPLDAYGDAVLAVVLLQVGKIADADQAIKNGIEADPDDMGVRTAQAFFALKENKTAVLSGIAADLAKDQAQRVSVNYFLMCLYDRQQRYVDARKAFEKGVLAQPAYPDLYIEQANNSLQPSFIVRKNPTDKQRQDDQIEKAQGIVLAKMYFETALIARPEASDALAGMAVISLLGSDKPSAVKYGEASRDASPDSAIGHYAVAAAYLASGRANDARTELHKAAELDPSNLQGRPIPNADSVWRYLVSGGRIPVLSPPQG
jgi:tetratricopeptide (TPR) repeat protein